MNGRYLLPSLIMLSLLSWPIAVNALAPNEEEAKKTESAQGVIGIVLINGSSAAAVGRY
jgi:hypothetical protein